MELKNDGVTNEKVNDSLVELQKKQLMRKFTACLFVATDKVSLYSCSCLACSLPNFQASRKLLLYTQAINQSIHISSHICVRSVKQVWWYWLVLPISTWWSVDI